MTSIEWLIKELYTEINLSGDGRVLDEILEEAKEMHRLEIEEAQSYAISNADNDNGYFDCDKYYQETFVSGMSEKPNNHIEVELPQQEICINCDEEKETHEICMDCISKLIKENQQETLYTEEQLREAMDFARGHHKMTDTQFIQSLKQPKKD